MDVGNREARERREANAGTDIVLSIAIVLRRPHEVDVELVAVELCAPEPGAEIRRNERRREKDESEEKRGPFHDRQVVRTTL